MQTAALIRSRMFAFLLLLERTSSNFLQRRVQAARYPL